MYLIDINGPLLPSDNDIMQALQVSENSAEKEVRENVDHIFSMLFKVCLEIKGFQGHLEAKLVTYQLQLPVNVSYSVKTRTRSELGIP